MLDIWVLGPKSLIYVGLSGLLMFTGFSQTSVA
jgi:hypothetical protein